MTPHAAARSRWRLWGRFAVTLAAWVVVVACAHRLMVVYQAELTSVLNSPGLQIAATALLLTALAYLVVLTLPAVPNLTPRSLGVVVVWAALLAVALYVSRIGLREAQALLVTLRGDVGVMALVMLALAYAVALAMPFVPGMELGLLIMVVFGTAGVLVAYAATIIGLAMAYMVGRILPARVILAHLKSADGTMIRHDMVSAMPAMLSASRLGRSVPPRLVALLSAHRYLALAVCLNVPANAVVGGGGGIALLCGMSGQFAWWAYLLTIAIATSPVPILMLTGLLNLDPAAGQIDLLPGAWAWLQHLFDPAR